MNSRSARGGVRTLACCLVLILIPLMVAVAQGRRDLTGTGIGSDIAVPGEPRESTTTLQGNTQATVVEVEPAVSQPAPPESPADVPSPSDSPSVQQDRSINEPSPSESPAVSQPPEAAPSERPAQTSTPGPTTSSDSQERNVESVSNEIENESLPGTAGQTSLLALFGILALAGAASLRWAKARG
jgi:hypothetical protein